MKNVFIQLLLIFTFLANVSANDFLKLEHNISSELFSDNKYATEFQVIAQVLESTSMTGIKLNNNFQEESLEYIYGYEHNNTEFLSRKIIVASLYGQSTNTLTQELLTHQNKDGGFGELKGYASSILDTAFALKALTYANSNKIDQVTDIVNYLINLQNSDGSWGNVNEDRIYLTAFTMHSLWLIRDNYDIASTIQQSQTYLENLSNANGLWTEKFESAMSLIAIAPMLPDNTSLQTALKSFRDLQLENSSWDNDIYTTVLIEEAIYLISKPIPNPDLGSISGTLIDGDSGILLSNVNIKLFNDTTEFIVKTKIDGTFHINKVLENTYNLTIEAEGYNQIQTNLSFLKGEHKKLGNLLLIQNKTTDYIIFSGIITDNSTKQPLEGVKISFAEQNVITDTAGKYLMHSDSTGLQTIKVFKDGYITESLTLDFKIGTTYNYAPSLKPSNLTIIKDNPYSLLFGVIKDINTSLPIKDVQVLLTGDTNFFVKTDINGTYSYEPLNKGTLNLTLVKSGYKPLTLNLNVSDGDAIEFSPYMERSTIPEVKNIKGVIFDSIKNVPLADAVVKIYIDENNSHTVQTDIDGNFELQNIEAEYITLTYTKDTYKTLSYGITLSADYATGSTVIFDLGQIRLRPISADIILPDLVAIDMNISELYTNPQELMTKGNIHLKIKNVGTSSSTKSFKTIAFFDGDNNGIYNELNDTMVGIVDITQHLDVNKIMPITIPINSKVPFLDAYLTVQIDSNRDIIEIDESNNNILTTEAYNTIKSDVRDSEPVIKWQWELDNPLAVYSQPIAVPLEDTNSDGLINEKDIASIVFTFTTYSGIDGTLIALSGVDGHELWRVERGAYAINNSLMAADIDQDGIAEIVVRVVNYGTPDNGLSSLVAYEHDGTTKWKTEPGIFQHYYLDFHSGIITDLEGDGSPEIICYGHVFDSNGVIKWSYPTRGSYSPVLAVDLDLDGIKEVIVAKGAYSSIGELLWATNFSREIRSISIANFDDDKYPEILFHGGHSQFLLNHNGSVIWGPINAFFNGVQSLVWGSGSITNVDYDSQPEIIMANIVLKTDGSILWDNYKSGTYFENHGKDQLSFTQYTLAFDFNQDGRSEIFSFSTDEMSILDGLTGVELIGIPSNGFEKYKYPIVVDLDHDGSSEIINVESSLYGSSIKVTVWEDANNGWASTKGIWNQPDYYINNINDDGTIPKKEEPSWLDHNTFRTNPAYNPYKADATLSLLKLHDNGINSPYSISLRVGNGGNLPISKNLQIIFYDGNPQDHGIFLGSIDIDTLSANNYKDITLNGISEIKNQEIYAIVDETNLFKEYNENNNKLSIPVISKNTNSTITTFTDKSTYDAGEEVVFSAVIENPGRLSYSLQAKLEITDSNGSIVEEFSTVDLGLFSSGEIKNISQLWNTSTLLSGTYLIKATLYDTNGKVVNQATTSFIIASSSDSENLASLNLETDKFIYHTSDTVYIDSLVNNLSLNSILRDASLDLVATNVNNIEIFKETIALSEMAPSTLQTIPKTISLNAVQEGEYQLTGKILSSSGELLAQGETSFKVHSDIEQVLNAEVNVLHPELEQGDIQECNDAVYSNNPLLANSNSLRQLLVRIDTNESISSNDILLSLDENSTLNATREIDTDTLEPGEYACILQVADSGEWKTLAYDNFILHEPPIKIDYSMSISKKAKLLILLDEGEKEWCFSTMLNQNYNKGDIPNLSAQKETLKSILDSNDYLYTIVTDEDTFTNEFRSGHYGAYLILSENIKLSTQVQNELQEAIYRGDGLLVAGNHDNRNAKLENILGINYQGRHRDVISVTTDANENKFSNTTLVLKYDDALKIKNENALSLAYFYTAEEQKTCFSFFCSSLNLNNKDLSAITYNKYKLGNSVYFAFDPLIYMAEDDLNASLFSNIFIEALDLIQPDSFIPTSSTSLPITITLSNLGIEVYGHTVSTFLNSIVQVVDSGKASLEDDNSLYWDFFLTQDRNISLNILLALPDSDGSFDIETNIWASKNQEHKFIETFSDTIDISLAPSLDDVKTLMDNYNSFIVKRASNKLKFAIKEIQRGKYQKALSYAIDASVILRKDDSLEAQEIRLMLSKSIKALSTKVESTNSNFMGIF